MRRAAAIVLVALAAACAPSATPGDKPSIARVHAGACGACHRRVEPGTRTRAQLEAALARHHRRVHLSDAEWRAMVDYLAKPASEASATP